MLGEWLRIVMDVALIAVVGAGITQVTRLIKHLAGLQQSRAEMERFVHEFGSTVDRAQAGIKGLRTAARESGDDLEKLVEKATQVREELTFLVESADQIAERLSQAASLHLRTESKTETPLPQQPASSPPPAAEKTVAAGAAPSRAEQELMQALRKLT